MMTPRLNTHQDLQIQLLQNTIKTLEAVAIPETSVAAENKQIQELRDHIHAGTTRLLKSDAIEQLNLVQAPSPIEFLVVLDWLVGLSAQLKADPCFSKLAGIADHLYSAYVYEAAVRENSGTDLYDFLEEHGRSTTATAKQAEADLFINNLLRTTLSSAKTAVSFKTLTAINDAEQANIQFALFQNSPPALVPPKKPSGFDYQTLDAARVILLKFLQARLDGLRIKQEAASIEEKPKNKSLFNTVWSAISNTPENALIKPKQPASSVPARSLTSVKLHSDFLDLKVYEVAEEDLKIQNLVFNAALTGNKDALLAAINQLIAAPKLRAAVMKDRSEIQKEPDTKNVDHKPVELHEKNGFIPIKTIEFNINALAFDSEEFGEMRLVHALAMVNDGTEKLTALLPAHTVDFKTVDELGNNAAHIAAYYGNVQMLAYIGKHHPALLNQANHDGYYPLHYGLIGAKKNVVEAIMRYPVDLNATISFEEGKTLTYQQFFAYMLADHPGVLAIDSLLENRRFKIAFNAALNNDDPVRLEALIKQAIRLKKDAPSYYELVNDALINAASLGAKKCFYILLSKYHYSLSASKTKDGLSTPIIYAIANNTLYEHQYVLTRLVALTEETPASKNNLKRAKAEILLLETILKICAPEAAKEQLTMEQVKELLNTIMESEVSEADLKAALQFTLQLQNPTFRTAKTLVNQLLPENKRKPLPTEANYAVKPQHSQSTQTQERATTQVNSINHFDMLYNIPKTQIISHNGLNVGLGCRGLVGRTITTQTRQSEQTTRSRSPSPIQTQ